MADWATISSLATAGGTLVLAVATFASVRSANRSARVAELAFQEQRRPVLVHSRSDDRVQTIGFADGHWVNIPGGGAAVEVATDTQPQGPAARPDLRHVGVIYLALSLRNVGAGIAVLQAWYAHESAMTAGAPRSIEDFRPLTRDQYIPSGDIGILQCVARDPADPLHAMLTAATAERRPFSLDLLYTDQIGGQRTISRFGLLPGDDGWLTAAARHWYLDAPAPR